MPPKGVPLSPAERIALFLWALDRGATEVAEDIHSSPDSLANWIAGICSPYQVSYRVIVRKVRARGSETAAALREAARLVSR